MGEGWCFPSGMRVFRGIKGKIADVGLSTGNRALNRLAQCFPNFFLWRNPQNNFLYPEEPLSVKPFAGRKKLVKRSLIVAAVKAAR